MFEIRTPYCLRSCANCNASNYEHRNNPAATIYEIKIGIMVNALCADCLRILVNQITDEIEI